MNADVEQERIKRSFYKERTHSEYTREEGWLCVSENTKWRLTGEKTTILLTQNVTKHNMKTDGGKKEKKNESWFQLNNTKQHRTALEKCTHLYDYTQGTIKHKRFRHSLRRV